MYRTKCVRRSCKGAVRSRQLLSLVEEIICISAFRFSFKQQSSRRQMSISQNAEIACEPKRHGMIESNYFKFRPAIKQLHRSISNTCKNSHRDRVIWIIKAHYAADVVGQIREWHAIQRNKSTIGDRESLVFYGWSSSWYWYMIWLQDDLVQTS